MKTRTIIASFGAVLALSLCISIPIVLLSKDDVDSSRTKTESALATDSSGGNGDRDEHQNKGSIIILDESNPESGIDRSSRLLQIAAAAVGYEIVPCSANNICSLPPCKSNNILCPPEESALKWMLEVDTYESPYDVVMEERFVLATLFFSTGRAHNLKRARLDHCEWLGVRCFSRLNHYKPSPPEGQSVLHSITLTNKKLTGSIPSVLGRLKYLRELVLNRNQLRGKIPPEIGNIKYLRRLLLEDNKLRGKIPTELANLKRLKTLKFYNNGFKATIPQEICQLGVRFLMGDCNVCPSDDGDCCNKCARPFTQPPTQSPSMVWHETCSRTAFKPLNIKSPTVEKLPISHFDEGTQRIQIGFDFHWLGGEGSTNEIVVDANGQININPNTTETTCCGAIEIGTYENPRIAVAQADLSPSHGGDILVEKKDNSIVISWEDVNFFSYYYSFSEYHANAQAELFQDGSVQMCYGEGSLYYDSSSYRIYEMTAGIEAGVNDPLFPNGRALNYPLFGEKGLTKSWPGGECFCFNPNNRKWRKWRRNQ